MIFNQESGKTFSKKAAQNSEACPKNISKELADISSKLEFDYWAIGHISLQAGLNWILPRTRFDEESWKLAFLYPQATFRINEL